MRQTESLSAGIPVNIRLESRQGAGPPVRSALTGKLYVKTGALYLRYEEAADGGGRIASTLRWDGRTLRLIRGGAVESAQTFEPGRVTGGYYRTPLVRLELRTMTHGVDVEAGGRRLTSPVGMDTGAAHAAADHAAKSKTGAADAAADGVPAAGSGSAMLPMTWRWTYRLEAGGEDAGEFAIQLIIRKA